MIGTEYMEKKRDTSENVSQSMWAHLDLNQGPTDYESVALTV